MMNVMITSASRKVSLVRAFQEALARYGGGHVIPVDAAPFSAALYESPVRFIVPCSDDPAFIPALLDLCRTHRVKLLVPTRDEELPVFARQRHLFEQAGTRVMVAGLRTIEICQDKKAFLDFCRKGGFSIPQELKPEELKDNPRAYPVFVRKRRGKASRNAFRVDAPRQLAELLQQSPDLIIQEFISAPEYTVDLFSDFDGRVISVVPRQRLKVMCGESFVGKTFYHRTLIDQCCRLARRLGLIGHNTIQCFLDGTDVKFIEVNPRFGGGADLGFAAGAHTPSFLVRLVLGLPVPSCIGEFRRDLVMLRYTQDHFIPENELLRGNDNV